MPTGCPVIKAFAADQVIDMFDLLPDILFWICSGVLLLHANQRFLQHTGLSGALLPLNISQNNNLVLAQLLLGDQQVFKGKAVVEKLEMQFDVIGALAWFITSKQPLRDHSGQIIGYYAIARPLEKPSLALSHFTAIKIPLDYIQHHYRSAIALEALAARAHLSVSALERRFKKYLGKTPTQVINQYRLETARKMLSETSLPIATVANEVGFTDPGYFSRQYQKHFGEQPSSLRKNIQTFKLPSHHTPASIKP